jgi:hypothetical protein
VREPIQFTNDFELNSPPRKNFSLAKNFILSAINKTINKPASAYEQVSMPPIFPPITGRSGH